MSSRSTFELFGLVIHGFDSKEIFERLDDAIEHGQQTMIVTTNPEILMEARRSPSYWQALRQADIRTVDSFGLSLAGRLKGAEPKRLTGVTLSEHLLQKAIERNWKVAMIGGLPQSADKAAWEIRKSYPSLQIFAERGGDVTADGTDDDAGAEMRFRLTQFAPDILLVAFGHPKQELWIVKNLAELPTVKVAVGVGGTLDYWAHAKQRAPIWMQSIGLEWLYRLIKEPTRWKRIFTAVFLFPLAVLRDSVFKK
jgi:N-acetylglucosaminyldiphosphoundecaprenol N-acetyl-beta-D-mannosaminyltransferase